MHLFTEIPHGRSVSARIPNGAEIEVLLGDTRIDSLEEMIQVYSQTLVHRGPDPCRAPPLCARVRPPPPRYQKSPPPDGPVPRMRPILSCATNNIPSITQPTDVGPVTLPPPRAGPNSLGYSEPIPEEWATYRGDEYGEPELTPAPEAEPAWESAVSDDVVAGSSADRL